MDERWTRDVIAHWTPEDRKLAVACGVAAFFVAYAFQLFWEFQPRMTRTQNIGIPLAISSFVLCAFPSLRTRIGGLLAGPIACAGAGAAIFWLVLLLRNAVTARGLIVVGMFAIGVAAIAATTWKLLAELFRRRVLAICSLLLSASLPALDLYDYQLGLSAPLSRAIAETPVGSTLALKDITRFDWDEVAICGPHCSPAALDDALGFDWKDDRKRRAATTDAYHLMVFTRRGKVVYVAQPPSMRVGFCSKFSVWLRSRHDAVFEVDALGAGKCLELHDRSGTMEH